MAWLVDFLTVACQFHNPRFSDPPFCASSHCVQQRWVCPLPGVSAGEWLELKCILVLSQSESEGCICIGGTQHLRKSHLLPHIGELLLRLFSPVNRIVIFFFFSFKMQTHCLNKHDTAVSHPWNLQWRTHISYSRTCLQDATITKWKVKTSDIQADILSASAQQLFASFKTKPTGYWVGLIESAPCFNVATRRCKCFPLERASILLYKVTCG